MKNYELQELRPAKGEDLLPQELQPRAVLAVGCDPNPDITLGRCDDGLHNNALFVMGVHDAEDSGVVCAVQGRQQLVLAVNVGGTFS